MNKNPLWLALALILSLTGCATGYTPQESPSWLASSTATQEQIWGPFHDLAGTTWTAPNQNHVTYQWVKPNEVLGEEFRNPTTGALVATNAIMPGKTPGTLQYTSSIFTWHGNVDGSTSVVFIPNNPFSSFRLSRTPEGAIVRESVTLQNGIVVNASLDATFTPLGLPHAVANAGQLAAAASDVDTSPISSAPKQTGVTPLVLGQKTSALFDARSQTTWFGVRIHLYSLPARRGQEVVVLTECNIKDNPKCWYMGADVKDALTLGWDEKIETPKGAAYKLELDKDFEVIRVAGNDDVAYKIYVVTGAEAAQRWAEYRSDEQAFAQEKAGQAAETERRNAESRSNNAATFNAIMAGLSQGLAEGAADHQVSQNNQTALLNSIAQTAQAAQAQQAYSDDEYEDDEGNNAITPSNDSSDLEAQQDAEVAASIAQTQQLMRNSGADPAMLAQLESVQQELQQRQTKRKQQAGSNKILPSKIHLSTATNSITAATNLPAPASESNNMAQGKVRLCNRPGDEGPAHWPTCPQTRAEEAEALRLASQTGSSNESAVGYSSSVGSNQTGPGSSGNGSKDKPDRASTSDDEAYAWCTQNKEGFRCWGPMGKMGTVKTLQSALGTAGCGKGEGDTPAVGETTYFECNIKKDRTGFHSPVPENPPSRW